MGHLEGRQLERGEAEPGNGRPLIIPLMVFHIYLNNRKYLENHNSTYLLSFLM